MLKYTVALSMNETINTIGLPPPKKKKKTGNLSVTYRGKGLAKNALTFREKPIKKTEGLLKF